MKDKFDVGSFMNIELKASKGGHGLTAGQWSVRSSPHWPFFPCCHITVMWLPYCHNIILCSLFPSDFQTWMMCSQWSANICISMIQWCVLSITKFRFWNSWTPLERISGDQQFSSVTGGLLLLPTKEMKEINLNQLWICMLQAEFRWWRIR